MIARNEVLSLIKNYLRNEDRIKASMVVEAILRRLAKRFEEDEELWGITGLLHNLDYEYTEDDQHNRGVISAQVLDGLIPEEALNAIKANNYINTDHLPETPLDKALISAEAVTCLILSTLKVSHTQNIEDIDVKLLFEKFEDSSFAPSCNRNRMKLCNDLGLDVKEFLSLSLDAFLGIKEKLDN